MTDPEICQREVRELAKLATPRGGHLFLTGFNQGRRVRPPAPWIRYCLQHLFYFNQDYCDLKSYSQIGLSFCALFLCLQTNTLSVITSPPTRYWWRGSNTLFVIKRLDSLLLLVTRINNTIWGIKDRPQWPFNYKIETL